jgi:hypothetical protein
MGSSSVEMHSAESRNEIIQIGVVMKKQKSKDWSDAYLPQNVEVRHIKTKADLERESALLKTEKLTKCIEYKVAPRFRKVFNDRLFYGHD